jgi:hypothetical protein
MMCRERTIWVRAALGVAVASMLPFPAVALTVEQCSEAADVMAPHFAEGDYKDLGDSLISYSNGGCVEDRCWNRAYLVNCRSGETLEVNLRHANRNNDANGVIEEAVESATQYTFSDVGNLLTEAGFASELTKANREICACKALYPNDRRGKTPYVFESMFEDAPSANGDD